MERGEGGVITNTHRRRDLYILYNIQPFYGSSTFMAHYDYEWSLTPHRAQSCDTEWLLQDACTFFVFLLRQKLKSW